jgi:hypothetical protein
MNVVGVEVFSFWMQELQDRKQQAGNGHSESRK